MFNSTFNKAFLSTLSAALVATGLSFSPAMAGDGGGGGGRDNSKFNSISITEDNVTTTVRGQNGSDKRTVTRTKNGQILDIKVLFKNKVPFISTVDPDGTVRIVAGKPKRSKVPFVTLHNDDGTTTTVAGKPSHDPVPSITMHHADGTSTTIRGNR